jgi:hypothetical protein
MKINRLVCGAAMLVLTLTGLPQGAASRVLDGVKTQEQSPKRPTL